MVASWESVKSNLPKLILSDDLNSNLDGLFRVPGLGTSGWETAPSITWSGKTLVYSYSRLDKLHFSQYGDIRLSDYRPVGWPNEQEFFSSQYGTEIYAANKKENNIWTIKNAGTKINKPLADEDSPHLSNDGKILHFWRLEDGLKKIYSCNCISGEFENPVLLPSSINSTPYENNTADNPFLTDNNIFLFDAISGSRRNILACQKTGSSYSAAITFSQLSLFSLFGNISHPWMSPDGQQLLFCFNESSILRLNVNNPYSGTPPYNPLLLISFESNSYSHRIGHPSMDRLGNIYFSFIYKRTNDLGRIEYDSDIFCLPANI